ncbi:DUF1616 domain-containing protein [Haloarchaeobius sp. HME9146]|uniref:DUF1616 domain-containing protein n=1 Tax=Haloarchaeobius sp. HME9146 TaxID=2978732 RepID=UPI0021C21E18|nr:DUF1616 domain-containing protein [Haloarchaeobius sp. HME9146]MCT9095661.1 DUF1616 domain-containing protein [Haloarchaeobius sp. HME9146]
MSRTKLWFLDAFVVLALAALGAFSIFLNVPVARLLATALFVLFLPGYTISVVLFPRGRTDRPPDGGGLLGAERFGLTVALSISIVALVALVANFTPWGITLLPILVGVAGITGFFAVLSLFRRWRVPAADRYAPSVPIRSVLFTKTESAFRDGGSPTTVYNVALVVSVLLALGSVGFAVAYGPTDSGFTEFAVDTEGQSVQEAAVLQSGENPTLLVENHEGSEQEYTMVTTVQRVSENADGATVVEAQRELGRTTLTAADGERVSETVSVSPPSGDDVRVVVMLYRGDAPDDPSRETAYRVVTLRTT